VENDCGAHAGGWQEKLPANELMNNDFRFLGLAAANYPKQRLTHK
jgi:hypothetical protein